MLVGGRAACLGATEPAVRALALGLAFWGPQLGPSVQGFEAFGAPVAPEWVPVWLVARQVAGLEVNLALAPGWAALALAE